MEQEDTSPYYRAVVEQSPIGIVVYGRDLRVVECNERFAELIQSSRALIIGLAIDDLRDQRHRAAVLRALKGETVTYESPYQATTSDTWPWLRATFAPLRDDKGVIDGVVVMVSDDTARITAESDARNDASANVQLRETQRFGHIGSWTWDAERGIAAVSPEFLRILGLSADWEPAPPKRYASLIHPDDRVDTLAQLTHMIEQRLPLATRELRMVRPDGTEAWVAVKAQTAIAADGELLSAWGLIQDVTERRLLEQQLCQARKMESIGQLAAGIAHDFNNVLTVIRVESQFLEVGLEREHEGRESLLAIQTAADHAAGLTKQLLAFSRKQLLLPRLLDVNDTVAGATQMLRRLIGERIELLTDLKSNLPAIFVDEGQLVQALINLVVNARDAMPGGGKLAISTGIETIADRRRDRDIPLGDYVVIAVSDTGQGMDQVTRRRIFEPFFTTKAPGQGTGLGLSTVHGIVQRSAAHITVDSEPSQGATFKLYFPAHSPATVALRDSPRAVDASAEPRAAATVLLVEDEPAIRSLCQRVLEREGHTVFVAEDGYDALEVAKAIPGRIDLLLTDMLLPTLTGSELYDRLKLKRSGLPVLYMSGLIDDEGVRRSLSNENASLLQKPFVISELVSAVNKALSAGRAL